MQDIHDYSMTGGGGGGSTGRFYGGGGGGDRRMRAHQNNILNHHLKCPRCNSLNTNFCYYNNYNLSQPRHFCKNCRRYWTKGGVLRNVPVGGGCRKAKRSKPKQDQPPSSADKPTTQDVEEKSSSSESSSLTASNFTTTAAAVKVASSGFMGTDMPNNIKQYGNDVVWSTLFGQGSLDGGVFSETNGFAAASTIETTPFEYGGSSVNQQCIGDHLKFAGNTVQQQFGDRTAQVDPNMGFESLNWGSGGGDDQTLFDLTSTVDHSYWSQSQWTSSSDHQDDQNGLHLP
ncbi:dof zinc finger protein DOF5.4-like [Brassica rapa]|uniref:Dof zinc finger protein n=2 Tax=Brassica campestris TaxID=3711 RepID=A0A3P6AY94_BRACM|nr:dof zinc finger protein DOF5.4-like [Brassica rapa]CAG7895991.1 unnamed protein product [Brassica rapa]VDC92913.1 unnamed protein product [Brassica rapa]